MKRIIALFLVLCAVSVSAQTFTCPAGSAITFSCGGAVVPPAPTPTPVPTQVPTPTPNPTPVPTPGWTVNINPLSNVQSSISQYNSLFDVNRGAVWIYSVPPNVINAHRIVAVPGIFPANGVQLMTNQYVDNRADRYMCISDAPGKMIGVGFGGCREGTEGAFVFITLNAAPYGVVILDPNKEYWLNVKAMQPDTPMNYLLSPQPM